MVSTELAGGATIDRHALAIGRAGLMRLLHHFGVLPEAPPGNDGDSRLLHLDQVRETLKAQSS
jgi:predicted deacylase